MKQIIRVWMFQCQLLLIASCVGADDAERKLVNTSAVVIIVDNHHRGLLRCSTGLLRSVRTTGKWDGAILVVLRKGDRLAYESLEFNRIPVIVPEFSAHVYHNSTRAFDRLWMFTDPRFLSYSNLLYLDADGLVSAPIIPAFKALRHSNWPWRRRQPPAA